MSLEAGVCPVKMESENGNCRQYSENSILVEFALSEIVLKVSRWIPVKMLSKLSLLKVTM